MSRLIIRYSDIYDMMLAQLLGQSWEPDWAASGYAYEETLQKKWDPLNEPVFTAYRHFGLKFPSYWLAYPVHPWPGLIPFSDPLTLTMSKDNKAVISTLIHELAHLHLTYYENQAVTQPLWTHIHREFQGEDSATRAHLPVNLLQWSVMARLFGQEEAQQRLAPEKSFQGLARAWAILGEQAATIDLTKPLASSLLLKINKR
jgi:hypothetical protein